MTLPPPPPPPADWPDLDHSVWHEVEGIRWHVQRQGRGPTLLLVHGTGGATASWAGATAALAEHFDVVAVDLPGHGFTSVPSTVERARDPYALVGMARELGRLLQALDCRPQFAAGHSAGVSVLLRMTVDGTLAADHLLGFCPALVAPPAWYVALIAPLLGTLVERDVVASEGARVAAATGLVRRMLASTGSTLTATQLARYAALCAMPTHVHAALTMMARWDLPALYRDMHRLSTPLELIAARGDRWIPLAPLTRAVAAIPGVTLRDEAGGHLLIEERPTVVVESLLRHHHRPR